MNLRSITRRRLCIACGVAAVLITSPVFADEIRVSGGGCTVVRVVARDARLSDVLKRLAHALDFELSFEAESDPVVSVNAVREPVNLLALLAPAENVSLTQARDVRCPDRERIVKVWVLPKGRKSPAGAAITQPVVPANDAAEQARKAQEGIDMILKSHGIPTSEPEEQAPENPH
jgi:hypothetical protein